MKKLILKKGKKIYEIDVWNIQYNLDKIKIIISGMDAEGMYYQIKASKIINQVETEFEIEMEIKE